MNNVERFAERLITLREEKGMSQQDLADVLGVTRQSLSLYEKAERTINIDLLVKMADFFGVSTDYMLGRTDAKPLDAEMQFVCGYLGLSDKAVEIIRDCKPSPVDNIPDSSLAGKRIMATVLAKNYNITSKTLKDIVIEDLFIELCKSIYEIAEASFLLCKSIDDLFEKTTSNEIREYFMTEEETESDDEFFKLIASFIDSDKTFSNVLRFNVKKYESFFDDISKYFNTNYDVIDEIKAAIHAGIPPKKMYGESFKTIFKRSDPKEGD